MYWLIFSFHSNLPTNGQVSVAAQITALPGVRRLGCIPKAKAHKSYPMLDSDLPLLLPPNNQRHLARELWNFSAAGSGRYIAIGPPSDCTAWICWSLVIGLMVVVIVQTSLRCFVHQPKKKRNDSARIVAGHYRGRISQFRQSRQPLASLALHL